MNHHNKDILIKATNVSINYYTFPTDLKLFLTNLVKGKKVIRRTNVFSNVSFELKRGEIICLGGSNGSGKSTLLYAICDKIDLAKGNILINGELSAFLEGGVVNPVEPGINLLVHMAYHHGQNNRDIHSKLDMISNLSGLPKDIILYQPLYTYSKGMTGRLKSSFYLLFSSQISLYDEIFGGGDVDFVNFWIEQFGKKLKNGASSIVASHSQSVWTKLAALGARFIILGNNTIAYNGHDLHEAKQAYMETVKYKSRSD